MLRNVSSPRDVHINFDPTLRLNQRLLRNRISTIRTSRDSSGNKLKRPTPTEHVRQNPVEWKFGFRMAPLTTNDPLSGFADSIRTHGDELDTWSGQEFGTIKAAL